MSESAIKQKARELARKDMEAHPCKCGVCFANLYLMRISELRRTGGPNA